MKRKLHLILHHLTEKKKDAVKKKSVSQKQLTQHFYTAVPLCTDHTLVRLCRPYKFDEIN